VTVPEKTVRQAKNVFVVPADDDVLARELRRSKEVPSEFLVFRGCLLVARRVTPIDLELEAVGQRLQG
jgi:recombinational DNA repair protein RecR